MPATAANTGQPPLAGPLARLLRGLCGATGGAFTRALDAQRGHLFLWLPVMLSFGIGLYFSADVEPDRGAYALAATIAIACALVAWRLGPGPAPPFVALAFVALGFLAAGGRAHSVAEPVLGFRYYGSLEGRILLVDRSSSDAMRLTLDHIVMREMAPARTPARVRVSLHGPLPAFLPVPGTRVALTANLSPPEGPVEPGGFDFQRLAWFDGLGAVGYSRAPMVRIAPVVASGPAQAIRRLRVTISAAVQARLPGEEGAFAAAILTGDRSGMSLATQEALRASNLAHLLAISGLHMGLLTGIVLGSLRMFFALLPPGLAHRVPGRRLAAAGALAAGAFYLALSGGNVATVRAFIMVSVMLVAAILGRRALTLRAVALAALILLVWQPEVLGEPGFQMSFAATVALVAIFGIVRDLRVRRLPGWLRWAGTLVMSSTVAGLATAPVAAAHFNRIADFGLIANLLSVPLMGALVMPAAVLAAGLAPFGLAGIGLALMRPGIAWILGVAQHVSALEGALTLVRAPPPAALPLIGLGGLIWLVWQGRLRHLGVGVMLVGLALWSLNPRPDVLISPDGGLVGMMTPQGRSLSKPRGAGFAARVWLENDGDGADQVAASGRGGFGGEPGALRFAVGDLRFVHLSGRGAGARVAEACRSAIVISSVSPDEVPAGCRFYGPVEMRATGAIAITTRDGHAQIVTARGVSGQRLWNSRAVRQGQGPRRQGQ